VGQRVVPQWALDVLSHVYDPCCREKGISVVDMGLVRSVDVDEGHARVELLLTSGWCESCVSCPIRAPSRIGRRTSRPTINPQYQRRRLAMLGDVFVFDGVAHPFNFTAKNAFGKPGEMFSNHLYAFHTALTPDDQPKLSADEFLKEWTPADIQHMVYDESDTDMLVAMPLPLTDLYRDGLSPWEVCAELASRDPERTVLWGSVNPLEGRKALDLMERQVKEFDAKAFKFYNVRYDYGTPFPWRMDDPQVAFPIFEKAQELGVNLIGVHKGVPLGPQPIEHTQTWDMDGAAANFPDINFVIYHVGLPFLDETCWQLIRYPNLYASLAATINFLVRAPRMFAEILGKLLFWCGEDKIVYGSEAPLFHPQWALKAFMDFEIPQDLCDGYGYPQLTDQAKRKILGENLLRLHGMDVESSKSRLGRPQSH
jgi:predicted TIM-barrel fold metal-dependent hydrolase